jgi:phenylpyruvate tautomerase PptA (4-oxalocrotonate tautomerase family)
MPLVRIDLMKGRPPEERAAIGDAVHEAMTETIDIPADDRFQIITEHEAVDLRFAPDYMGGERDDRHIFIQFTMKSGRTVEQKRALYQRVTALLEERVGQRPGNLLMTVNDNELADWSFGYGRMQLID